MRLGGFVAVAMLVLVTLASSFSQTFQRDKTYQQPVLAGNIEDHMAFTRELADHSAKLDALKNQHDAMADLPVRMARIEERLNVMQQMVWAILAGILGLIGKEVWSGIRALSGRGKG